MVRGEIFVPTMGATGALGSVIADRLSRQRVHATTMYRHEEGLVKILGTFKDKVTLVKADATDEQEVIAPLNNMQVSDGSC